MRSSIYPSIYPSDVAADDMRRIRIPTVVVINHHSNHVIHITFGDSGNSGNQVDSNGNLKP